MALVVKTNIKRNAGRQKGIESSLKESFRLIQINFYLLNHVLRYDNIDKNNTLMLKYN